LATTSIHGEPGSELKLLQALVYQECGMYFDERRVHFLQDRLHQRLKACRLNSLYSYYRLLTSQEGKQELAALLEHLTINETSFFRNQPQLELFQKVVLDRVLRTKQERRDWTLRIWSAGASTGQEPYSLAMLCCDVLAYYSLRSYPCLELPEGTSATPGLGAAGSTPKPLVPLPWQLEIMASDINYAVLHTGQQGVYTEAQMENVGYSYRLRYFDKIAGGRYAVKPALKQFLHFDFHNLKTEFLPQRNDFIFCRNVMIYFDEAEQKRLIEKFWHCLKPGGYLFLGHTESLYGLSDKFRLVHKDGGTAYERIEANT
jgi:chemotaxis protein methyltransferase CheR